MSIVNETQHKTLSENVSTATNPIDRGVGLLRSQRGHTMIFHTRFGIHTIGMKYAIDVLILNDQNKVVKLKKNLKPNNIFLWNPKYSIVIELPAKTIEDTKTSIGDKILL